MRVVVASCEKYRDAWGPCFELLRKFWPDCPYQVTLLTDGGQGPQDVETVRIGNADWSWCSILSTYMRQRTEPVLLLLEDLWLNAPVNQESIQHALAQMQRWNAGMVRLYPCPGANAWYDDARVGFVGTGQEYRISAQASIWSPDYLYAIASMCDSPWSFEIQGSKISERLERKVLAWRREAEPWPLSYFCTAINRGIYDPAALEFCRQHGIEVDTSLRGVA